MAKLGLYYEIGEGQRFENVASLFLNPNIEHFNKIQKLIFNNVGGKKASLVELQIIPTFPNELVLADDKLFYFELGADRVFDSLKDFRIDNSGNRLEIGLELSKIIDLNVVPGSTINSRSLNIQYSIQFFDADGETLEVGEGSFDLKVLPIRSVAEIESITPAEKNYIVEHKGKAAIVLGYSLSNKSNKNFANPAIGEIICEAKDQNGNDYSAYFCFEKSGVSKFQYSCLSKSRIDDRIYLDCSRFDNPPEEKTITLFIINKKGPAEISKSGPYQIILRPDSQKTELAVKWKGYEHKDYVILEKDSQAGCNFALEARPQHALKYFVGTSQSEEIFCLKLINKASQKLPPGAITFTPLRIDFNIKNADKTAPANNFLEKAANLDISKEFNIANGARPVDLRLRLRMDDFNFLPLFQNDDIRYATLKIDSNYSIKSKNHDNEIYGRISFKIDFQIVRSVTKWLGVDFGTSAIAAYLYDERPLPLNLSEIHKKKVNDSRFLEDKTKYLCSMMYLDYDEKLVDMDKKSSDSKIELNHGLIKFAPIHDVRFGPTFPKRILPNLKTLMGYDYVPHIMPDKIFVIDGEDKNRLPVKTVIEAAYIKLFREYILAAIKNTAFEGRQCDVGEVELLSTLGNIVVTVPNTFNQVHENILRKLLSHDITWRMIIDDDDKVRELANRRGPVFFEDKIEFISESDAVVIYYIENRKDLVPDAMKIESEKVLIYDIGAGTLDITYASYSRDKKTDEIVVKELGKLGTAQAGNTIDTLLAEILCLEAEKIKGNAIDKIFNNTSIDKDFGFANVASFKDFIQNWFKKWLSTNWDKTTPESYNNDFIQNLRRSRIWNEEDFKTIFNFEQFKSNPILINFLNRITYGIMDRLLNIVDPKYKNKEGKLEVDRVIISGRTILFTPLMDRLKTCLLDKTTATTEKIVRLKEDALKDAVVLGALYSVNKNYRFEKRQINAYYGILYEANMLGDESSKFVFRPALEPGENPFTENGKIIIDKVENLFIINFGDINLTDADKVMLIKSFVANPHIDFYHDRADMFSKITEIRKETLAIDRYNNVPVSLRYRKDPNFRMKLRVMNTGSDFTDDYVRLESNLSYEEVTWPYNSMIYLRKAVTGLLENKGKVS